MELLDNIFFQMGEAMDNALSVLPAEWASGRYPPLDRADRCGLRDIGLGVTTVNGIELSQLVLDQLRLAGINPQWCTHHELNAARQGAAIDCDVFDEDDGDNFYDDLELDADEIAAREARTEPASHPPLPQAAGDTAGFRDRLQRERLRKDTESPECWRDII